MGCEVDKHGGSTAEDSWHRISLGKWQSGNTRESNIEDLIRDIETVNEGVEAVKMGDTARECSEGRTGDSA
jgi:hypothetical protein